MNRTWRKSNFFATTTFAVDVIVEQSIPIRGDRISVTGNRDFIGLNRE